MMKAWVAVALLVSTSTGSAFAEEPQLPELVVKSGQTIRLSAQRYEYSRVTIERDGVVEVMPGGDALHLVVRGPVKVAGTILARGFSSQERQVTLAVPGRAPLTLPYRNANRGGAGGDGGAAAGVPSGRGARGDLDTGGGGGSGGGRWQDALGTKLYPGRDATDDRGAQGGPQCGGRGGNAGGRSEAGNGGVVYLEVYGDFDGTDGRIDVSGQPGARGADGQHDQFPSSSYGCQGGAGGGGGGGPGGQGGFVVGYVQGVIAGYPSTVTVGGSGGAGGASPSSHDFGGGAGGRGQAGASGAVYWFGAQANGRSASAATYAASRERLAANGQAHR